MMSLITFLCFHLKCNDEGLLNTYIRCNRKIVLELLRKTPLYIAVSEYGENCGEVVASGFVAGWRPKTSKTPTGYTETPFNGLSTGSAKNLFARGGQEAVTVAQYYSVVTGESLKHPGLPCIIERRGSFGGELYIPMELVNVDIEKF